MRGRYGALAVMALAVGMGGGAALERLYFAASETATEGPKILYWVAPMDPNFRRDAPGKSPMGMDLIPVYEGQETSSDPAEVKLSPEEINAIGVRTATATRATLSPKIHTVGFVEYDQTLTSHIHVRNQGWIEGLKVRAVGEEVRKGDLLFEIYTPELAIATAEYQRALRTRDGAEIAGARRKLRNFGATDRQIEEVGKTNDLVERLKVYAPQDGVVVATGVAEGMYLKPDVQAMTLTDAARVWVMADVFKKDVGRVTPDMRSEARFEHLPGRVFEGTIDYIYRELDPKTRTLPVRLSFPNPDGALKPAMFAEVTLIAPTSREAVTLPAEAVIRTGRAERVVLALPDGRFRPRLVTTGVKEDGRAEILQGLQPGDRVVASAQFLIDSESSLNAGFLRMAPTDAEPAPGKGALVALDRENRTVTIAHEAIPALDWPAMTTRFTVAADAWIGDVSQGTAVKFEAVRGADGVLTLARFGADDGIDATGTGTVAAVLGDVGKLTLRHDPVPALGWGAMTMDLPVGPGVDISAVPVDRPVEFDLAKGDGGLYVIVAVRPVEGETHAHAVQAAPEPAPAITARRSFPVHGVINTVDTAKRTANISHGDIAAIGMPGMTMDFALDEALDPGALPTGSRVSLTMRQEADFSLTVTAARPEVGQ